MRKTLSNFLLLSKKEVNNRKHLIKELIETESDYVNSLSNLIKHYKSKLEEILGNNDVNKIFNNIVWIHDLNSKFEEELKKCNKNSAMEIFDMFDKYSDLFKAYGTYSSGYKDAIEYLDNEKLINQSLSNILNECELSDPKKWNIDNYLIIPIQRICKYPLLLKGIIDLTEKEDKSLTKMQEIHNKMDKIVVEVNQFTVKAMNKKLTNQLEKRLSLKDFTLIRPNRVMLHHAEYFVKDDNNKKVLKEIYFFNDVVIYMTPNKPTKNNKNVIRLKECEISQIQKDDEEIICITDSSKKITHLFLYCKNRENFNYLVDLLENVLKKLKLKYQYLSLGLVQQDKKNYHIKYREVSVADSNVKLKYCCMVDNNIWILEQGSVIKILSTLKRTVIKEFFVDEEKVEATQILYDSQHVIFTTEDGKIIVYDPNNYNMIMKKKIHPTSINVIAYGEKSKLFASAEYGTILIWRKKQANKIKVLNKIEFDGKASYIYIMDQDNQRPPRAFVSASSDEFNVYVINNLSDTTSECKLEKILTVVAEVNSMCCLNNLLWLGIEQNVYVHELTGEFKEVSLLKNPHKRTNLIAIIPISCFVITFGQDSSARVWDSEKLTSLTILEKHNDQIFQAYKLGENVFSISKSGEILEWLIHEM